MRRIEIGAIVKALDRERTIGTKPTRPEAVCRPDLRLAHVLTTTAHSHTREPARAANTPPSAPSVKRALYATVAAVQVPRQDERPAHGKMMNRNDRGSPNRIRELESP